MTFAELLKAIRRAKGLSLRTAATQIGINHTILRGIENGVHSSGETFFLIFRWLMTPEKKVA